MQRLLIAYKYVPKYRAPFFRLLRERLSASVELRVSAGTASAEQATKSDSIVDDWYDAHTTRRVTLRGRELIWQTGLLGQVREADAAIVEQANSLLVNQVLLALPSVRLGFWGHGYNHQAQGGGLSEWWKDRQLKTPEWWFAYTNGTASYLRSKGVDPERITVVQNAVDTRSFASSSADSSSVEEANCWLYMGSLYEHKRIEFLIEAAKYARELQGPSFKLLIAGDGPKRADVQRADEGNACIEYVGRVDNPEVKLSLARRSCFFVNPGLVGLGVVEAFALGLPVATIRGNFHSPEFAYLEDGSNSVIFEERTTAKEFASHLCVLSNNARARRELVQGAANASSIYRIENMVENFALGVEKWLSI